MIINLCRLQLLPALILTIAPQNLIHLLMRLVWLGCHPLDSGSINYKGRNQDMAIRYMTGAIPVCFLQRLWIAVDNYSASIFMALKKAIQNLNMYQKV